MTLEDGAQYQEMTIGDGPSPKDGDRIAVHYSLFYKGDTWCAAAYDGYCQSRFIAASPIVDARSLIFATTAKGDGAAGREEGGVGCVCVCGKSRRLVGVRRVVVRATNTSGGGRRENITTAPTP